MESLTQWMSATFNISGEYLWLGQLTIVLTLILIIDGIQRHLLGRLHNQLSRTKTPWDDALVGALQAPISLLIWIVGLSLLIQGAFGYFEVNELSTLPSLVREVGIIASTTWFLLRLANKVERNFIERGRKEDPTYDITTPHAIGKLSRVSIAIIAGLIILQQIGISISGILAFGGIGGIAVGFAAKDLLANFFGGMMLYLDRPFSVGDWIRSPDRNIEGTVEDIGWRLTRIRTFDKRPLYVPNATFANIAVENPSRMSHRRIYETIGVRYDDTSKLPQIVTAVKTMLKSHPDIDTTQTMIVNFNSFAPSSLDFFVYTFTKTTNWIKFHEVKQDVLFKISAIIEEQGAEIAFPTSTLHVNHHSEIPIAMADTGPQ